MLVRYVYIVYEKTNTNVLFHSIQFNTTTHYTIQHNDTLYHSIQRHTIRFCRVCNFEMLDMKKGVVGPILTILNGVCIPGSNGHIQHVVKNKDVDSNELRFEI